MCCPAKGTAPVGDTSAMAVPSSRVEAEGLAGRPADVDVAGAAAIRALDALVDLTQPLFEAAGFTQTDGALDLFRALDGAEQRALVSERARAALNDLESERRDVEAERAGARSTLEGIRERYPESTDREQRLRLAALKYGRDLMVKAFDWDPLVEGW